MSQTLVVSRGDGLQAPLVGGRYVAALQRDLHRLAQAFILDFRHLGKGVEIGQNGKGCIYTGCDSGL